MGEGSLLLRALHEHRDRRPNALIDEHHENLVLVAKENNAAAAHRGYGADLYFDNGFTHIANLVTRQNPNCFQAVTVKIPTKARKATQKSRGDAILGRFLSVLFEPISCVPAESAALELVR